MNVSVENPTLDAIARKVKFIEEAERDEDCGGVKYERNWEDRATEMNKIEVIQKKTAFV